jgi:hypothetical protein
MSGRISISFVDLSAFPFEFARVRYVSVTSFLVRKRCGCPAYSSRRILSARLLSRGRECQAYNLKVTGSNPVPATKFIASPQWISPLRQAFSCVTNRSQAIQRKTVISQLVSAIPAWIPNRSQKLHGTKLAQNGTKSGPKGSVVHAADIQECCNLFFSCLEISTLASTANLLFELAQSFRRAARLSCAQNLKYT